MGTPQIIIVENPSWIQKETSVEKETYTIIHNFGYDSKTTCSLRDGAKVSPKDTLDGVQYGWYECHLVKSKTPGERPTEVIARYDEDKSMLVTTVSAVGLLSLLVLIFGK